MDGLKNLISLIKEIMKLKLIRLWYKLAHSSKCEIYECAKCGMRDCPFGAMEHYWHDGCPICEFWPINNKTGSFKS